MNNNWIKNLHRHLFLTEKIFLSKYIIPGVPQNPKREVFFTQTYCQGMKLIALGKSKRPWVPRPVEMINFTKIYSKKESETNG